MPDHPERIRACFLESSSSTGSQASSGITSAASTDCCSAAPRLLARRCIAGNLQPVRRHSIDRLPASHRCPPRHPGTPSSRLSRHIRRQDSFSDSPRTHCLRSRPPRHGRRRGATPAGVKRADRAANGSLPVSARSMPASGRSIPLSTCSFLPSTCSLPASAFSIPAPTCSMPASVRSFPLPNGSFPRPGNLRPCNSPESMESSPAP